MELRKKIELYAQRPFGDKLNASFDFLKESWKPMFKFITYLLLPLSLVQAIGNDRVSSLSLDLSSLQEAGGDPLSLIDSTFWMSILLTFICSIVGGALLIALVYSLMKVYATRENRLEGITLTELKPLLLTCFGRALMAILFAYMACLLFAGAMGGLGVLSLWTLLLTIPAFVALMIPLFYFIPIYLFEDSSLFNAFGKSYRLGFPTWGGLFVIALLMGIIGSILGFVTGIPYSVASVVKHFFSLSDAGSEATVSVGYNCFLYVLGVLKIFGSYLGSVFVALGIAYQYGHASEKIDGVTITSDIDNFDNL